MKRLLALLLLIGLSAKAQDNDTLRHEFTINGYLKNMQTLTFDDDFSELISGNFLHNRINLKWKPSANFSHVIEIRNRLFWGEALKLNSDFTAQLKNKDEQINLQKIWINQASLMLLSNIERLYSDIQINQLNIRLGRQRINWGIGTTWNPNDIFNAYNFLDFDYEERSGVDAAKMNVNLNDFLNIETAYAKQKNGDIVALKSSFNKWNYDFQLIGGWYKNQLTLGSGWAGAIKDAGFKGEIQYYLKSKNTTDQLNLTLESDYTLKKGWYFKIGFLFNSDGLTQPNNQLGLFNTTLSPKNLMPTKWNFMLATAKEINPRFSANLSLLYAAKANSIIFYPSIVYNLAQNLDFDLVWQSFFLETNNNLVAKNHECFLRLKLSY